MLTNTQETYVEEDIIQPEKMWIVVREKNLRGWGQGRLNEPWSPGKVL